MIQIILYCIILICLDRRLIQNIFNKLYIKFVKNEYSFKDNQYTLIERDKVENPQNEAKLTTKLHNVNKFYRGLFGKVLVKAVNQVIILLIS